MATTPPSTREKLEALRLRKAPNARKIAMLTAYDYPTARLLEEGRVDILLVGDSLGMVVLGYPDTTLVTMDEMVHHTRAVRRGAPNSPVVADLSFGSYTTPESAVANARRLVEAGADAVKLEGGRARVPQIEALTAEGIAVMGHLGMLPQSVREEGGYHIKGKTPAEAEALLEDARAITQAGVFGIVLELVRPEVTAQITAAVPVPTVGIGAGRECDGQVLVVHDLVGAFPWFTPKFAKRQGDVAAEVRKAVTAYMAEVSNAQ